MSKKWLTMHAVNLQKLIKENKINTKTEYHMQDNQNIKILCRRNKMRNKIIRKDDGTCGNIYEVIYKIQFI